MTYPNAGPQAPILVTGHLASTLRWHMVRARAEQEAGTASENLDIAARHFRRADEHLGSILVTLEIAEAEGRQAVEVA